MVIKGLVRLFLEWTTRRKSIWNFRNRHFPGVLIVKYYLSPCQWQFWIIVRGHFFIWTTQLNHSLFSGILVGQKTQATYLSSGTTCVSPRGPNTETNHISFSDLHSPPWKVLKDWGRALHFYLVLCLQNCVLYTPARYYLAQILFSLEV